MNTLRPYLIASVIGLWIADPGLAGAEKIVFAYPSPSTSFLPLVVAQKKGFFESENLQAEVVQIRPAVAIPGLTLGSVDYTATHFLTVRVLKAVGLDPEKDVTLRPVGDEGLRLQALITGLVQASLLGSQGVIESEKAGLKVVVAAADVIDGLPFAGVTTTLAKLKENPQQIKKVLRAGLRGRAFCRSRIIGVCCKQLRVL